MTDPIDPAIEPLAKELARISTAHWSEDGKEASWTEEDWEADWKGDSEVGRDEFRDQAREILTKVAPFIAAKALRDFADAHRLPFVVFQDEDNYPHTVNDLLRAEAEGYAKKVQS